MLLCSRLSRIVKIELGVVGRTPGLRVTIRAFVLSVAKAEDRIEYAVYTGFVFLHLQ